MRVNSSNQWLNVDGSIANNYEESITQWESVGAQTAKILSTSTLLISFTGMTKQACVFTKPNLKTTNQKLERFSIPWDICLRINTIVTNQEA